MPVLLSPVNFFLGQVIGNASEGKYIDRNPVWLSVKSHERTVAHVMKYNTVNNSSSGEVTFQERLNSGNTLFSSKNSN